MPGGGARGSKAGKGAGGGVGRYGYRGVYNAASYEVTWEGKVNKGHDALVNSDRSVNLGLEEYVIRICRSKKQRITDQKSKSIVQRSRLLVNGSNMNVN